MTQTMCDNKMNFQWKEIIKSIFWIVVGGIIGWWIAMYMDRPDISYYVQKNQQAKFQTVNSQKVLTSWRRTRKNPQIGNLYSSSVYIRNTGHHAYKGEDLSKAKEPLRVESNEPIALFTVDDKQSPESTFSVKEKDGIYYIEFDFLNYGRSVRFVFTHHNPIKHLWVRGAGLNLPSIRENTPFKIWVYHHSFFSLGIFIVVIISFSFVVLRKIYSKYTSFDEEYYQLIQQFLITKNKKEKEELIKRINALLEKHLTFK